MRIKMTVVLMIAAFLQVSANGFAQKITLSERNASLEQLFAKIKKQSGYTFLYSPQLIKRTKPVSLTVTNEPLISVLEMCLEGQPLTFAINQNTIVVRKREEESTLVDIQFKLFKGKVVDTKGMPLPGVTVKVKNKNTTKISDANGDFSLDVEDDDVLILSYIGYRRKEVAVSGKESLRITLEEEESELKNVVVIGYGKQDKHLNPSSISRVDGEKLQNRPSGSIEGLLQGLAPGLIVQNNSGQPGGRSKISIRGVSDFSSSANSNVVSTPLFIIDGVPLDQDTFNPSNPREAISSVLGGLNPFDVESVDVLKDAAATAIYGSRGANGVIIITTKRGKAGKPIVTLNTQFGGSTPPQLRKTFGGSAERNFKLNLFNSYQSSKVGGGTSSPPMELTDSLNSFYNNSTDWQELYFRNATLYSVNLGVSGASENASYRLGADYYNEKGVVLSSGYKRYSLTYQGIFNPTKKLTITGRVNVNQQDAGQRRGETFNAAVIGNNFSSSFAPGPSSGFYDAFLESYNKGVNIDLTRNLSAQLEGSLDITDYLNVSSRGSARYQFYRTRGFNPSAANLNGKASASYYAKEKLDLLSVTNVRLHHTFANAHTFDFLIGSDINTNSNDNIYGSGVNGPNDAQQVIQGYAQSDITLQTNNITYGLLSYYSRLSYDFNKKYIFQGVIRRDGSSKFGKDKQWGNFLSASAAWVFTKENFFANNVGTWFSFGKLRGSVGKAGQQYQDDYLALGAYNTGAASGALGTYNGSPILAPNYAGANGLRIPDLTWQTSKDYGVGLDLEFFNSRLTAAFDYYHKAKDGFLFTTPLSSTSGYAQKSVNSGNVLNTGFEAGITGYLTAPDKRLQYSMTLITTTNKNVLTKLPDYGRSIARTGYSIGEPYLQIGKPLNGFYLLEYLGVFPDEASVPINPYTGGKLRPVGPFAAQDPYHAGDIHLRDVDGDGRIDGSGNSDRVYMGDPNPKVTGSFSNTVSFRLKNNSSFQFSFLLNYSIGNKVYNKVLADRIKSVSWTASTNVNYPGGQRNLLDVSDLDVWTPTHTNAKYPVLNPWRYYLFSSYDFIGNYEGNTSLFLEDGSFVRLSNVTFGYDFSPKFLQKAKIRRLRVFAGLENIFLLTKYTGVDPENVDDYGYDIGNGYPVPKKFNLGFNFEF
ncbi:TonB-linked outer membrane protein, SusC/RagA family [Pedobacter nyackensis]|uniref:TonB-linked outer membrane protein, SusC/RagA family n=2 Tax=Pedobacter nyackensis TaxID=475255 RepID=A0A1W2AHE4_9SPHI|nr:TonB-linked outer membrane protein, SusC/RagA family [Pedobacter nyackensis]